MAVHVVSDPDDDRPDAGGVGVVRDVDVDLFRGELDLHLFLHRDVEDLQHLFDPGGDLGQVLAGGVDAQGAQVVHLAVVLQGEHGDVVGLLHAVREGVDGGRHVAEQFIRCRVGRDVQGLEQPLGPEEVEVSVCGLGDAVCVDEECVAGLEGQDLFAVLRAAHAAEDEAMLVLEELERAVGMAEGGVLVARVGGRQDAGRHFEDAEPGGDEHVLVVAFTQLLVDVGEDFGRRAAQLGAVLDHDLGRHHEEGGRGAFAGNVRNDEAEVVVVDEEEVIEVAADFLGGGHMGVKAELVPFRERREGVRDDPLLDAARDIQFAFHPVFLGRDRLQVLGVIHDGEFHLVDVHRQQFDLVFALGGVSQRDFGQFVVPGEPDGFRGDPPDRFRDSPANRPAIGEGDQRDHDERGKRDLFEELRAGGPEFDHLQLDAHDTDDIAVAVLDGDQGTDVGSGGRLSGAAEDTFFAALAVIDEAVLYGILFAGGLADVAGQVGAQLIVVVDRFEEEADFLPLVVDRLEDVDERGVHPLGDVVEPLHGGLVFVCLTVVCVEVRVEVVGVDDLRGEAADPVPCVRVPFLECDFECRITDQTAEDREDQQRTDDAGDDLHGQFASQCFQHNYLLFIRWSGCRQNR